MTRHLEIEAMLNKVIDAWEALPGGRSYSVARMGRWLEEDMAPAINEARALLQRPKPKAPDEN